MDNGNALQGFTDQVAVLQQIAGRLKRQQEPVSDPTQIVLARDPKTGKRKVLDAVTDSGIGIRFKPLTIGEARGYPSHTQGKPFAHWPAEDQVRLLTENLVSPDFVQVAGGPLTVEWTEANFDWLSLIEIGTEILTGSRVDFRVPLIRDQDEKKGRGRQKGSPARSRTASSTKKATPTSGNETSSD